MSTAETMAPTPKPVYCKKSTDFIRKFEETDSTCDQSRSGRPSVAVEIVAEVHEIFESMCVIHSAVAKSYGPKG